MKPFIKIIAILFTFIFLLFIAGFFILPPLLKPMLIEKLSQTLHRQVSIEKIKVNPWQLSATVKGLSVKEGTKETVFVACDELYINFEGLSSFAQKAAVLKEIRLTRPSIIISRHMDGSFNFSDLIPPKKAKTEPEEKPLNFSLSNVQVIEGSITFQDEPNKKTHTIREMNLSLPFISNMDKYVDRLITPRFSAKINGSPLELSGKAKPFSSSRDASIDVEVQNLDIPYYMTYVPVKLKGRLVSALLAVKLKIDFMMQKDKPPYLMTRGKAVLKEIVLEDLSKHKILRLPAITVDLASVLPFDQDIHLAKVTVQKPEITVKRGKDGKINLLNILPPSEKKSTLKTRIDELAIDAAEIQFQDLTPHTPVNIRLSPLNFRMLNFSTEKGAVGKCDLSLSLEKKKGDISIRGPLAIDPLMAEMDMDVRNLNIRTFQAYFNEKVKIDVTRGAFSSKGKLSLFPDGKGEPKLKFKGIFSLSDFASVDRAHANAFVNWKQLYFDGINAGYNPFSLYIKGISLQDYFVRISIAPDGKINMQDIFVAENKQDSAGKASPAELVEEKAETPEAKETARNVKIDKVTLQGGKIDFTDRFIKPNYSARMLNMSGSVTGLSSAESSRARVDLKGNLGYGSPIEITGGINPLIKHLFTDMSLSFKNIELSPITPYASKYLGHPILKGKLTYDAQYLIDKGKLDARNKVFIDQLTFGDRVESPNAIKAPVKLAVALLADRNGHINLDIPVSGSLNDPKFKVWPIVWQVIVNLITKAVTSPFALLSSLTGGGEEMSYIEFEYGSAQVTEANMQKIKALVKVLTEKPGLKMDIEGRVDEKNDIEGLKTAELKRKGKTQKLIEVTDSDLRQLATRRAERVKELILKSGEFAPDRIFLIESGSTPSEKKEKAKDSRTDIKLK